MAFSFVFEIKTRKNGPRVSRRSEKVIRKRYENQQKRKKKKAEKDDRGKVCFKKNDKMTTKLLFSTKHGLGMILSQG